MKYLVILLFVFIIATDLWSRAYGFRVKELFETYGFLFLLIPLGVFLLYTYMEHQKYKEERAKAVIKGAFQQYVAPEIIEELLKHPEKLKLGGEKRQLTIFFSDIHGFTNIAEQLPPEQLVHLLNEYLSAMTEIILKHSGVVDKYIGDAIMAFWGAPIEQPNHAELACTAVIEMTKRLQELQANWHNKGIPELRTRIGLNTGEAIVGNMGSSQRFDYTVMGDAVNIASRLEGLNKIYGTSIIISESVWSAVKHSFAARELDLVQVKGRKKPIAIYELLCKRADLTEQTAALIEKFETGLKAYRAKKWKQAVAAFKDVLEVKPNDGPAMLFIQRCAALQRRTPRGWSGIYAMDTK